ncbi:hypothetical protein CDAR_514341 [Caerostris darwini]|uniref:Uncharacterized protein n=1 Tax=Caerostris darwini TaxID=1538125 RepID=A0AAV4UNP9_9ARAC|nr:hypothetical protein CDAR_514341 [Caerostris darwini]
MPAEKTKYWPSLRRRSFSSNRLLTLGVFLTPTFNGKPPSLPLLRVLPKQRQLSDSFRVFCPSFEASVVHAEVESSSLHSVHLSQVFWGLFSAILVLSSVHCKKKRSLRQWVALVSPAGVLYVLMLNQEACFQEKVE